MISDDRELPVQHSRPEESLVSWFRLTLEKRPTKLDPKILPIPTLSPLSTFLQRHIRSAIRSVGQSPRPINPITVAVPPSAPILPHKKHTKLTTQDNHTPQPDPHPP